MQIFVSLKVPRTDPQRLAASHLMAEAIRAAGHTPFVAWQEIERRRLLPAEFMPFVRQQVRTSGLMIVLYHPELRGGLVELGMAYAWDVPVWLVHQCGETVSSSAQACAQRVLAYTCLEDLGLQMTRFLERRDDA